ncbi:Gfo/Idh/MocA family protein [Magnetospira sp. QH-2]|uniref:Gfo/Idh/MocA family protein n=1 Tax=Magnetospira sp. (strain QH-2) TaxID=1288970 RepID=UPI0003E81292|nr:Gfo/Idh/MocA family oxidoreductase [Magnetospira sp. QH-2]CCQ75481.1 putative Oxidoreductase [Magnetospira sp. QH-2]
MTQSNLKVALIGCGRIAGHHCLSIAAVDGVELAAVCDLVEDKAKAYAEQYGVPHFTNYHNMLTELPEIDLVAVITPSGMHDEHARDVMDRYGKHLIVEKPTFMRPSQMVGAYEKADTLGTKIFPVFQNRYNKAVSRVREALRAGELGDIRMVSVRVRWCRPQRYYDLAPWRGTFSHDGGCLTNQGIHHVDLLRHLGGEVARINATMRTMGADIEVEDALVATLDYKSGAIGSLEVTTAARPDDFEASLSIVGSEGLAQIGGIAVNELQIFTPDPEACAANSEDFVGIQGHGAVYGYGHTEMYNDIVADLRGGAPYPVDRDDCRGTLELLNAFYRSDEAGGWVVVGGAEESPRLGRSNDVVSDLYRTSRP